MVNMSSKKFIDDLRSGDLCASFDLTGAVKASEDSKDTFQLSLGRTCEDWIGIPLSLVLDGSIRVVGKFACKDHSHPIISFSLAQPSSIDGAALYGILKALVPLTAIEPNIGIRESKEWLMHMPPFNGMEIEEVGSPEDMDSPTAKAAIETYCSTMCVSDPASPYYGSQVCCKFRRNSSGRWPYYDFLGCYKFGSCVLSPNAGTFSR